MLISGVLSWGATLLLELIMLVFDTTAYGLAIVAISIFNGLARMDFFSTKAGASIYTDITNRIYGIIGIIMIFFFTYQLIMLVINPDGDTKTSSALVKKLITSVIMIAFFPTLYHYMAVFQEHVLTEGTIFGIVTGTASGGDSDSMGRNTALIVYLSMYHPEGGGYQSLVDSDSMDENGNISVKTAQECYDDIHAAGGEGASLDTCQKWVDAVTDFKNKSAKSSWGIFGGITAFTLNLDLAHTVFEEGGSEYMIIITFVCGFVLAWYYISYAIDLGYRTIKLGFLQIISPAPLVMRIFPKTDGAYKKWRHQMFVTYMEIFVRVAIIAFQIVIIQVIPKVVKGLFSTLLMSKFYIGFGVVAMIFGIMKFGKELPKLVKDMFSNGSGLLDGIDWKPGFRRRMRAGGQELIGYGKKAAAWTKKKVDGAISLPGKVKKFTRGVGGIIGGAKAGSNSWNNANPAATGINKVIGNIAGGVKGGMSAYNAAQHISSKTDKATAQNLMNAAASNAGGSVKISNLAEYIGKRKKILEATEVMDTRRKVVNAASSENSEHVKDFDKKLSLDTAVSNAKELKAEALRNFNNSADGTCSGSTVSLATGAASGSREFKSYEEIEAYYDEQIRKIYTSKFNKKLANGVKEQNFDKLIEDVTASGSKYASEVLSLDQTDAKKDEFAKLISNKMTSSSIDIANQILHTNYDASNAYDKIMEQRQSIDIKNTEIKEEIRALEKSMDRNAISERFMQSDAYSGMTPDQLDAAVDAEISRIKAKVDAKKAEIEANNETKIEKNTATYMSLEDINSLFVAINNDPEKYFTPPENMTDPDDIKKFHEERANFLKDLRDISENMNKGSNNETLMDFEAYSAPAEESSGDSKK